MKNRTPFCVGFLDDECDVCTGFEITLIVQAKLQPPRKQPASFLVPTTLFFAHSHLRSQVAGNAHPTARSTAATRHTCREKQAVLPRACQCMQCKAVSSASGLQKQVAHMPSEEMYHFSEISSHFRHFSKSPLHCVKSVGLREVMVTLVVPRAEQKSTTDKDTCLRRQAPEPAANNFSTRTNIWHTSAACPAKIADAPSLRGPPHHLLVEFTKCRKRCAW